MLHQSRADNAPQVLIRGCPACIERVAYGSLMDGGLARQNIWSSPPGPPLQWLLLVDGALLLALPLNPFNRWTVLLAVVATFAVMVTLWLAVMKRRASVPKGPTPSLASGSAAVSSPKAPSEPPIGTRVKVFGGYDQQPQWLGQLNAVTGVVAAWIPGQNAPKAACVIQLDEPLTAEGSIHAERRTVTGSYVVLELRYVGQTWTRSGSVHIELCESMPAHAKWGERDIGAWVESHATYEFLN